MLGLQVKKRDAEKVRQLLAEEGALARDAKPARDAKFVYFPLSKKITPPAKTRLCEKRFAKQEEKKSFRERLKESLSQEEFESAVKSFDLIGDVAVIEIPRKLKKKAKQIARSLKKTHPSIRIVVERKPVRGKYRVRRASILAGTGGTETIYRESGCAFKLDVAKVFFSPRLSFERARIASQTKQNERVLVLFAGVGPYAITIAKQNPSAQVVAVELNPVAVYYLKQNLELNKAWNATAVEGDAKKFLEKNRGWNRIVMPLPKGGHGFLGAAIKAAAPDCVIHFYAFCERNEVKKEIKKIASICRKLGRKCTLAGARTAVEYSPKVIELVVDLRVA
jgi:tRNA (guanine37-N1)-methyltransferase